MNRQGQEEIVGFVVVLVLIAIVALVFLAFSLREDPITRQSVTLTQFSEALGEYTTTCSLYSARDYARIGELYKACFERTSCIDERDSCTVLNETLSPLIRESLRIGPDRPINGYQFTARFVDTLNASNESSGQPIISLSEGNCSSGTQQGVSDFRPARGGIIRVRIATCSTI